MYPVWLLRCRRRFGTAESARPTHGSTVACIGKATSSTRFPSHACMAWRKTDLLVILISTPFKQTVRCGVRPDTLSMHHHLHFSRPMFPAFRKSWATTSIRRAPWWLMTGSDSTSLMVSGWTHSKGFNDSRRVEGALTSVGPINSTREWKLPVSLVCFAGLSPVLLCGSNQASLSTPRT